MEGDKRPCVQHSASSSLSSSISSETREANELEVSGSPPPGTLERTSDENEKNKEVLLHEGLQGVEGASWREGSSWSSTLVHGDCGRERLKRHRVEVAGRVWIPDMWGQEDLLKDWTDCSAFDAALVSNKIMSARSALMGQGRRARSSTGLRIGSSC